MTVELTLITIIESEAKNSLKYGVYCYTTTISSKEGQRFKKTVISCVDDCSRYNMMRSLT